MHLQRLSPAVAAGLAALAFGACGGSASSDQAAGTELRQGSGPVHLDPAEFTTEIDNSWWPMAAGTRWVYSETGVGPGQRVVVTITSRTRMIANGIEAKRRTEP